MVCDFVDIEERSALAARTSEIHVLFNEKIQVDFTVGQINDSELHKQRNLVERFFQRIKNYCYIAFRFDKLPVCFRNFFLLASVAILF